MGNWFGKLKELFTSKKLELCLVGLENSGKTTLLSVLSMGHAVETLPTVGLNVKYVNKGGVNMKVWDLGGQERFRSEWPRYTANCDVILFVVDGHDHKKIPTARKELHQLLEDKSLANKPLLVVLNKIDLEPRFTKNEIVKSLNLDYLTQPWIVAPISAKHRTNIQEVVDWLLSNSQ
mmetsp:Transcript_9212/g.13638  ORF Transcript_9212/g.13638 Transcript_9212/m.13638 type:complete len:177 (+) Transcript_9212:82-612(+)